MDVNGEERNDEAANFNAVESLKTSPSASVVVAVLARFDVSSARDPAYFALIQTLIHHTLPESYSLLPREAQTSVQEKFRTLPGVGGLLATLELLVDQSPSEPICARAALVVSLLDKVFDASLVTQLLTIHRSALERKEIDKLVFRGKVYSVLSQAHLALGVDSSRDIFRSSDHYAAYLAASVASLPPRELATAIDYLHSTVSFAPAGFVHYMNHTFGRETWRRFGDCFGAMRRHERKKYAKLLLRDFVAPRYLETPGTPALTSPALTSRVIALSKIVAMVSDSLDLSFLVEMAAAHSVGINKLVAVVSAQLPASEYASLLGSLIVSWADDRTIKTEPISLQEYKTHLLICMLAVKQDSVQVKNLSRDKYVLNGVSHRLGSFAPSVKMLATILANWVSRLGGQPPIFDLEVPPEYAYLAAPENYITASDIEQFDRDPWDVVTAPSVVPSVVPSVAPEPGTLQREPAPSAPESDPDPDPDSDDEDPTLFQRDSVPPPIYIKDLLEYLSVDSKAPQAYDMTRLALTVGPTLVRQKKNFGTEVSFYAEDLLRVLVGLSNSFNDKDFDDLKLNCMIAVVASHSASVVYLYRLLATGDYSLQQRMMILSTASLAARELKGFRDDVVTKSYRDTDFATAKLPAPVHAQFAAEDPVHRSVQSAVHSTAHRAVQDDLMAGAAEHARDELAGGTVLRVSRKLQKKPSTTTKPVAQFSKIISSQFFFPLVQTWYEAGGVDIGPYSPVLTGHFISTLTLMLHAAYPATVALPEMVREMLLLVVPVMRTVPASQIQLVESIITGVLLVLDVSDDEVFLAYHNELQLVHEWVTTIFEAIIDDKVKSLAANLVLRLSSLETKLERTVMDQVNSIY